jgi:hypothetical protein
MNVLGLFTDRDMAIKAIETEIEKDTEDNKQYETPSVHYYCIDEFVDDGSGKLAFSKVVFDREI